MYRGIYVLIIIYLCVYIYIHICVRVIVLYIEYVCVCEYFVNYVHSLHPTTSVERQSKDAQFMAVLQLPVMTVLGLNDQNVTDATPSPPK